MDLISDQDHIVVIFYDSFDVLQIMIVLPYFVCMLVMLFLVVLLLLQCVCVFFLSFSLSLSDVGFIRAIETLGY